MTDFEFWSLIIEAAGLVATVVITYLIYKFSQDATDAIKNREIETKFVEIATDVLSQPPTEENRELREWAEKILDKYSPIAMSQNVVVNLLTGNLSLKGNLVAVKKGKKD